MKLSTLAKDLKPYIVPWIQAAVSVIETQAGTGTAGGGLEAHALDGAYHTGTLSDAQAPQFLKTDGSRGLTGNLSVSAGVTIDTMDPDMHMANPAAHHDPVTAGDGIVVTGQQVAVDLAANSGLNFSSGDLVIGTPTAVSASSSNSVTTTTHTHDVTSTADGAANHSTLLQSDAAGGLELDSLNVTTIADAGSATYVEIVPAGDIILDPGGSDVLPGGSIEDDLGDYNRMWRTLFAAELYVETLVAQDVLATIGGRVMVAPTTKLIADCASGASTIDVEHNNLSSGGFVILKAAPGGIAQFEAMKVTSAASAITGGYRYSVTRNVDGTGANGWVAGDAVAYIGDAVGEGYIELTSTQTVHNDLGPNITVYVRTATTNWNDVNPVVSMGNLESFVDYSADEFGFATGNDLALTPTTGFKGLTADRTNGLRLFNTDIKLYNGATQTVDITAAGNVKFGIDVSAATSTGFTFTASSGDVLLGESAGNRVFWDHSANTLYVRGSIVVESGSSGYSNLTDKPTLGTLAAKNSVDLATGEVTNKNLDNVSDGSTYGRILKTIIGGGYIQVGSGTKDSTLDGWHVGSAEIVGQLNGADQVVLNTSGQIVAGAGAVMLDADGLALVYDTNWPTREIDSVCWYDSPTARTLLTARIGSYYGSGSKFSRLWVGAEAPTGGSSEVFLAAQVNSAVAASLLVSSITDKITLNAGTTVVNEALTVGTTLGVTGATTLSSTLGVSGTSTLDYVYLNADDTVTSNPPTAGTNGGWKLGLYSDTYAIGLATYTLAVRMGGSGWFSLFNNVNPSTTAATTTVPNPNAFYACNATYQYYAGELGEDWKNATPTAPQWADDAAGHSIGYKKFGDLVMLRGRVDSQSGNGSTTTIFTLPTGYRPAETVSFAVAAYGSSDWGTGQIRISSAGDVVFYGDASNWVALDGIMFSTSAA